MGKIKNFEIYLTNNKTVYHPGETVTGKCVIELRGDINIRAVRMTMRGVAKVHWTESRSTGTRLGSYTEHYNAEVEYFFKRILLFGTDSSETRVVMFEGRHEYEFQFELPTEGISTSFEGKHGSIRYWLKAEIDKPWTFNHRTKKAFTVICPIDINKPEYQMPVENNVEKSLCCWFCTSGPISITVQTDRRGYCPGESIAISAEFENLSSRTVIPYATLHQTQMFFANGKTRLRMNKFTVLTGLPINSGSRAAWDAQLLKIPPVSPTVYNCCVIRVEYYVKVALHIPGSHNLCLHLPIVVGTVPYHRPQPQLLPTIQSLTHSTAILSQLMLLPPPYRAPVAPAPDQPPPMYAESLDGAVDIGDELDMPGVFMYTPMYTYVYDAHTRHPPAYSEIDPHPKEEFVS